MNTLKRFGAMVKEKIPWLLENLGDLLIIIGLFMIPATSFFVKPIFGFYSLSVTLIIIGFIYIKGKGGE